MAKIFYLLKQNKNQSSRIFGKCRARLYLHTRRGIWCAGEVPQLSAGDAPEFEACED